MRWLSVFSLPSWSVIPNTHERFLPFSSIALVLYTYRNSLMSMASLWNYRMHLKAWNLDFIRILYIIFAWCDQLKIIIFSQLQEKMIPLYIALNRTVCWIRLLFPADGGCGCCSAESSRCRTSWWSGDALFADGLTLTLVDYVFVAMLLYIRDACKC